MEDVRVEDQDQQKILKLKNINRRGAKEMVPDLPSEGITGQSKGYRRGIDFKKYRSVVFWL